LLKSWIFGLALGLVMVPVAASAQLAVPTPAPSTAPASARPTPSPEHFISIGGAVTGKTFNELASGATTGGYGLRAVYELPIIGHNWMAQVDYRSYNYPHSAFGGQANGVTFACAAGDPGCVTPVGFSTYDRSLTPGPENYLNAFNAQDSTTQIGLGSKIAPYERYYISAGYMLRGFNYLNYPVQSGFGVGLDKLPDVDRAVSVYGGFWEYFTVHSLYTGPTAAGLGALSGYQFNVNYRVFAYRLGATLNVPNTNFFVDLADVGDRADTVGNGPSSAQHNAVLIGAGAKF
jgi:hypothetical protein